MSEVVKPPSAHCPEVENWIGEIIDLCAPDRVWWCDGKPEEGEALVEAAFEQGELVSEEGKNVLDSEAHPDSYLHRSAPHDVARVERLTYICTREEADAGPLNNWMAPQEAYRKLGELFKGCMRGRTMYVIPFLMGPQGSPMAKVGVQVTDSPFVVLNMRMMTRVGDPAWQTLAEDSAFTHCLHAKNDLSPERRFICHFPEDNTIWSIGSGYGGNALLGKKCMALRIGSYLGRQQGWLAEHMLLIGVENPQGEIHYLCAAFPSQCGKTNLSMVLPPEVLKDYKIWTVGDDIAWLAPGPDGRLWAINPEAGFFGVAPGTSSHTNPNAVEMVRRGALFTNAALTNDGKVWWEGLSDPPKEAWDWQGRHWTPQSPEPAAHPNSRFTVRLGQCPSISNRWDRPEGVPISAIIFGGRRERTAPLVLETESWRQGVYLGATMASETTAAAEGKVGVVRRDPFAMRPFCGYHIGDYLQHWLDFEARLTDVPKIFHVNWFRKNESGGFIWPGFRENLRVLNWIIERTQGKRQAVRTTLGLVPNPRDINREGLPLTDSEWAELLSLSPEQWRLELEDQKAFFKSLGPRVPKAIWEEWENTRKRFGFSGV